MSTLPDSPGERHLFRKLLSRAEVEICLTCPGQQDWDNNSSCVRWAEHLPLFLLIEAHWLPCWASQNYNILHFPPQAGSGL